jgi:ClpP class serine protease
MAASAAYWIASAADRVFIKDETTMVGSIGVVATHIDQSQADAKEGITVTEITAGKFKRIDSQHAPLSAEGQAMIQDRVDSLCNVFVSDVARNRGASVDVVLRDMADGRVFIGLDALERGLVDGVSTMDNLLTGSIASSHPAFAGATAVAQEIVPMPDEPITPEPEIVPVPEPVVSPVPEDLASAERTRIQGVLAQSIPGAESLIQTLAFDGKTTPDQAASAVLAFHKRNLQAEANSLASGAGEPVPVAAGAASEDTSAGLMAKWNTLNPAIKAAHKTFENFEAAMTRTDELKAQGRVSHFSKQK